MINENDTFSPKTLKSTEKNDEVTSSENDYLNNLDDIKRVQNYNQIIENVIVTLKNISVDH